MAMHVRFESLYISLPSSAKQQCEMTKFDVLKTIIFALEASLLGQIFVLKATAH